MLLRHFCRFGNNVERNFVLSTNWTRSICFDFVEKTKFFDKLVRRCCHFWQQSRMLLRQSRTLLRRCCRCGRGFSRLVERVAWRTWGIGEAHEGGTPHDGDGWRRSVVETAEAVPRPTTPRRRRVGLGDRDADLARTARPGGRTTLQPVGAFVRRQGGAHACYRPTAVDVRHYHLYQHNDKAVGFALPNLLRMLRIAVAQSSSRRVKKSQGKGTVFGAFFPMGNILYNIEFGNHAKMAQTSELLFRMMSGLGPKNSVLRWGDDPRRGRGNFWGRKKMCRTSLTPLWIANWTGPCSGVHMIMADAWLHCM